MGNPLLKLSAVSLLVASGSALAQSAAPSDTGNSSLETIIVTGTRQTGLKAIDSTDPIKILDAGALQHTGQPDVIQALAQNVPSFIAQGFGQDTANLTLAAALRGLNPNDTLILVNGKRLHGTANLAVDIGSPFQGAAAPDLSFIPVSAIDHVEILESGAAAQYGSDAIAGVINIILKSDAKGGVLTANGGGYLDGGGKTWDGSANFGFAPTDKSFVNFTAEDKIHGFSDRGGIDPRVIDPGTLAANPTMVNFPGYPHVNHVSGDSQYRLRDFLVNSGIKVTDSVDLYATASYGDKNGQSYENYRVPSKVPAQFPNGFNPLETLDENSWFATGGAKGTIEKWRWDVSSTFGYDTNNIGTKNSGNPDYFATYGITPEDFVDGAFKASQWTNNLDISRELDVGLTQPLNLAFGAETRRDTYEIDAGDFASRYKSGAQSFPGYNTTDAGQHARTSDALYVDVAFDPIAKLNVDLAARYNHFSDFGNDTVAKGSARYEVTSTFAVRGTVSTGFRAPTLAEEYYSATNVSPFSAYVQLPPVSAGAKLIGVDGLKPEKSHNFSLGIVTEPAKHMSLSVDVYQISLTDRIVGSGNVVGTNAPAIISPTVNAAIAANGSVLDPSVTQTGVNVFTNAAGTRTRGLDSVLSYASDFDQYGKVDWTAALTINHTSVTSTNAPPAQIAPQTLLNAAALSDLTTASPKFRLNLSALWSLGQFSVNLRESIYGPSSEVEIGDDLNPYTTKISTKALTDLDVKYRITPAFSVSIGANNLFNTYPDKYNPALVATQRAALDNAAVLQYPIFSPIGINGGYYYGRVTYTF